MSSEIQALAELTQQLAVLVAQMEKLHAENSALSDALRRQTAAQQSLHRVRCSDRPHTNLACSYPEPWYATTPPTCRRCGLEPRSTLFGLQATSYPRRIGK